MQFLRMLTNAVIGGALLAAYLTLLVLQLNPALDLRSPGIAPLLLTWWIFYGVHATAGFYAVIVVRQLLAVEVRSPGWISFRLLAWLGTGAASAGAAVMWMNVRGFAAVLEPASAERMIAGAAIVTVCAAACAVLAFAQLWLDRRGRRFQAALFALVIIASLAVPVALRGPGVRPVLQARRFDIGVGLVSPETVPRVAMILLDGASLDFVSPIAAEGRLPNFGRLLDGGAVMHLATMRPTHAAPVWTAVATGKLPYKNGVRSPASYTVRRVDQRLELLPDFCFAQALIRFGFVGEEAHTAASVRARPLWSVLSSFGITTGIVGWPLTYPAAPVRGYLVSDEFLHREEEAILAPLRDDAVPVVYPPELADIARAAWQSREPEPGPPGLAAVSSGPEPGDGLRASSSPLAIDSSCERVGDDLQRTRPAQFTAVRYPGLDAVGHYYLRYAVPWAFGDVTDDERRRFGRVLEQYYTFVDGVLGRAMASLGPDDVLVVVSGFGMEPLSLGKRALERAFGNPALSGSHERAPDGFLIAYGRQVARGHLPRASVVDVAPTILYLLGLPIGRDMDGYARTDIFTAAFTAQRPITFIPSYDQ
jgi:hypothetical protein